MLIPVQTVAPAAALMTSAEVKAQAHIDTSDDDGLITRLIAVATARLDGWAGILGRCLINQTWRQDFQCWPASGLLRLPFADVSTITSVKYYDTDNALQTVSSSLYELVEDQRSAMVNLLSTFTSPSLYDDRSDRVQVTFVAGYGAAASNVPDDIRHAALMLVAHFYENRAATSDEAALGEPAFIRQLIAPYRRPRL